MAKRKKALSNVSIEIQRICEVVRSYQKKCGDGINSKSIQKKVNEIIDLECSKKKINSDFIKKLILNNNYYKY